MTRMDHGSRDCNSQLQPNATASETVVTKDGYWSWTLQQPIATKRINLDRMDACKVTDLSLNSATFACPISTSQDTTLSETCYDKDGLWIWGVQQPIAVKYTTASETRHDTDGSWIWALQQSIAIKCINLDRKTQQHQKLDMTLMDHESGDCSSQSHPDTTASETRHDTDGSWIWALQQRHNIGN
ncbi:MAG: hypothetical protein J3Q66DRAFT_408232 [Benniella sp.]|nr:MAG: hypothetical protein J3Q66DRAFT_408232 [Benniella sp.]